MISLSILDLDKIKLKEFFKPLYWCPAIHMDIMDGKFVPNTSFDEKVVSEAYLISPRAIIDVHLMVENPDPLFPIYKKAHADYITFHYEVGNVLDRIEKIHALNLKAGLSINPSTKAQELIPYLDKIEMVLVMSVWPGIGGQKYIEETTEKLKFLKEYKIEHKLNYLISVDGGINLETIDFVKPYVDIEVIGSAITKSENPVGSYLTLLKRSAS